MIPVRPASRTAARPFVDASPSHPRVLLRVSPFRPRVRPVRSFIASTRRNSTILILKDILSSPPRRRAARAIADRLARRRGPNLTTRPIARARVRTRATRRRVLGAIATRRLAVSPVVSRASRRKHVKCLVEFGVEPSRDENRRVVVDARCARPCERRDAVTRWMIARDADAEVGRARRRRLRRRRAIASSRASNDVWCRVVIVFDGVKRYFHT